MNFEQLKKKYIAIGCSASYAEFLATEEIAKAPVEEKQAAGKGNLISRAKSTVKKALTNGNG